MFNEPKEFFSGEFIKGMVTKKMNMVPCIEIPLVDVRDVAKIHISALEHGKDGRRYIATNFSGHPLMNINNLLKFELQDYNYKFAEKEMGYFFMWLRSLVNPHFKEMLPAYKKRFLFDNSNTIEELGVEFRNTDESLSEMVFNLIDIDYIEDKSEIKYFV